MIKKSTLLVLLCAAIFGGVVYYLNVKKSAQKPSDDSAKPAFSIDSSNVTSLTLSRPAAPNQPPIQMVKKGDGWQIVQPTQTGADSSAVQSLLDGLATARVAQTEPGSADRLAAYGLAPAQISLEFQLQNGAEHTLLMGNADFSGDSTYSVVDGAKTVSLLPKSLYTSLDKSFDDLRDHAVLHIVPDQVASFSLKNSSGEVAATKDSKDAGTWKFTKPAGTLGDDTAVTALLSAIGNAKAAGIVSEQATDLAKYGFSNPSSEFTAMNDKSDISTLVVGKKDGDDYFARDLARPQIFRIDADLYKKLGETYADLRDKKVAHFDQDQIQHIELHDANGTAVLSRKNSDSEDWTMDAPSDLKGKSATAWAILNPVDALHADDVLDHPPANVLMSLSNPAVDVKLTDKSGKVLDVQVSKESGDFVYARTTDSSSVYKLKKQVLSDLNLKPSDLAP